MQRGVALLARPAWQRAGWWLSNDGMMLHTTSKGWAVGTVERDDIEPGSGHQSRSSRWLHSGVTWSSSDASPSTSSRSSSTAASSSQASSSELPAPGAPLKKITHHDMVIGGLLQRSTRPRTPTHHTVFRAPNQNPEESAKRKIALKTTLEKYRKDLMRGKNGQGTVPSPDALPFLEDTITHLVGREQNMLLLNKNTRDLKYPRGGVVNASRDGKGSPSRVRAMAMAEALRGNGYYGAFGLAETGLVDLDRDLDGECGISPQSRLQQSYIQKANAIIGIISAVEARVSLTRDEKMAVARAAAERLQDTARGEASEEGGHRGALDENSHRAGVRDPIRRVHGLETKATPSPDDVLDCLQLLDLPGETIARIISTYPNILFLDVDTHMLPILAYLSDLGLDDAEMGEIVSAHPSIFKPSNEHTLQSGVAFWTGKGLSRTSIVNLIKLDPSILETNKLVMQMKVDWLTEHTGLTVEELAAEPRTLSANLGAVTAPRISWLVREKKINVGDFDTAALSSIVGDEHFKQADGFLEQFGGEASSYEAFVREWYPSEFVPWLEKKSRMSEILLQQESDMVELGSAGSGMGEDDAAVAMQAFAAGKELAWEQQMEREREWHMAWHAWKREQQSMALAERAIKRNQHREAALGPRPAVSMNTSDTNAGAGAFAGLMASTEPHTTSTILANDADASASFHTSPVPGTRIAPTAVAGADIATMSPAATWPNDSSGSSPNANAINQRSVFFLSRKWTCDATIDEALSQAIADCGQISDASTQAGSVESFDPEILSDLSVERVQSCAVNLLLLLRASEYGTLEPKVFNAWASRSGVAIPELTAAKSIISSNGAAFVRSEPSWKYHAVPQKVWRLRDTAFYAPGLLPLRDTRGSRAVSDLAEVILKSLRQNPRNEPMTRMEISDMYGNKPEFHSKRMRFAIGLLLEQGMVIQRRRRGIASGPMELVLTESFTSSF